LIESLHQSVGLRVVGTGSHRGDTQLLVELLHQAGSEVRTLVG